MILPHCSVLSEEEWRIQCETETRSGTRSRARDQVWASSRYSTVPEGNDGGRRRWEQIVLAGREGPGVDSDAGGI